MNEYELAESIKSKRRELKLQPSHLNVLCGYEHSNRTAMRAENHPFGKRPILEHMAMVLHELQIAFKEQRQPTPEENQLCLNLYAHVVINRHHLGVMPGNQGFENARQEIVLRALKRMRNFRHGGKKNICEFAYMSCYFSLRDMQREDVKLSIETGVINDTRKRHVKRQRFLDKQFRFVGGIDHEEEGSENAIRQRARSLMALPDTVNAFLIGRMISELADLNGVREMAWSIERKYRLLRGERKIARSQMSKLRVVRILCNIFSDEQNGLSKELLLDMYRHFSFSPS